MAEEQCIYQNGHGQGCEYCGKERVEHYEFILGKLNDFGMAIKLLAEHSEKTQEGNGLALILWGLVSEIDQTFEKHLDYRPREATT